MRCSECGRWIIGGEQCWFKSENSTSMNIQLWARCEDCVWQELGRWRTALAEASNPNGPSSTSR